MSWLKKIHQTWRHWRQKSAATKIKRDIGQLERERAKEHSALLKQRRFYEKLLHHKKEGEEKKVEPVLLKVPEEKKAEPVLMKEVEEKKIVPLVIPEPEKIIEEKNLEIPLQKIEAPPIPNTSDIAPPKVVEIKHTSSRFSKFFKGFMKKSSLAEKLSEERQQEEAVRHKSEVEERFWQPYNSVKANLIKDQGVLFFNWKQRMLTLTLALVLSSLAIGLVYVGLLVWQKERLRDNEATLANFDAINTEITKNEREIDEIVVFNRKLDIVSFMLTNHVYWTNFFTMLEEKTLKDVYFSQFSGDLSGTYSMPAIARNLDAVSLQLEVLKAYTMVKTVQYSGGENVPATAEDDAKLRFSLDLTVDPKIFVK